MRPQLSWPCATITSHLVMPPPRAPSSRLVALHLPTQVFGALPEDLDRLRIVSLYEDSIDLEKALTARGLSARNTLNRSLYNDWLLITGSVLDVGSHEVGGVAPCQPIHAADAVRSCGSSTSSTCPHLLLPYTRRFMLKTTRRGYSGNRQRMERAASLPAAVECANPNPNPQIINSVDAKCAHGRSF
jgi:hypothetical protein